MDYKQAQFRGGKIARIGARAGADVLHLDSGK
jgi:hypothetical protein